MNKAADDLSLLEKNLTNSLDFLHLAIGQYACLYGLRGDKWPERAKYLGYLDGHESYPDDRIESLQEY